MTDNTEEHFKLRLSQGVSRKTNTYAPLYQATKAMTQTLFYSI